MVYDMPYIAYLTLYVISIHIINTNQRTSTHWKLNIDEGKVQATVADGSITDDFLTSGYIGNDPLMNTLTNKVVDANGDWKLDGENICNDCRKISLKNSDTTAESHSEHDLKTSNNEGLKSNQNLTKVNQKTRFVPTLSI